jgi:PhzF family phenazine biosynthesis protein
MNRTGVKYFVVDAFTDRPFGGNPAAVVPLERWREDAWLANVAREMNLSETAFFVPAGEGYELRWFTPKAEVDLCGHATLASAFMLADLGQLADGAEVGFSTRSGLLKARRAGRGIDLDFPLLREEAAESPAGLLEALGVSAQYVGRSRFDYLVEVASERAVRELAPDFKRLMDVKCRGVIVTARSEDASFDFVSRFFAPAVGVDEDPVTGSAHCCLAPYWGRLLGKTQMTAYQASPRGGVVRVEVRGDRVILGGEAVVFATGQIRLA